MNVLLIGNYVDDQQESMRRFAQVLLEQLPSRNIKVEMLCPKAILGGSRDANRKLGKWLGYVDKFILFPRTLRRHLEQSRSRGESPVIHLCDHSNAIYTRALKGWPHLVTCHDLLAIRSAHGEFPKNPTRWSGRQLQRSILGGLERARRITCISEATRDDLLRIARVNPAMVDVTAMGLNYPYRPMARPEAETMTAAILEKNGVAEWPGAGRTLPRFILHVGGNQWYKNRVGVLEIFAHLLPRSDRVERLVMVGKPFTAEMKKTIAARRLEHQVTSIEQCSNEELRALYSTAELLLFPSLEEGFGWPIIEAQACGCRVVTSRKRPMIKVGGAAAFLVPPEDASGAAERVKWLLEEDATARRHRIDLGLANASKFSTDRMIEQYVRIYQELAGTQSSREVPAARAA